MSLPGAPSLFFLAYLFVVLPWAAFRSARVLSAARAAAGAGGPETAGPSRESIWIRTVVNLGLLLVLSWFVGRSFDYSIFASPALGLREWGWAAGALGVTLLLRQALRALRPEEERRRLLVYFLAPRTSREWTWTVVAMLFAGVAEEAAYRGVAMNILWYGLGNPWLSAVLCAIAFALAHWMQGWKSGAFIFVLALVFHGLVALTGTLVLAMVVHVVYDLIAARWIARDAATLRADGVLPA
jgi:membrane protease YdiL (CAAX protease family)